MRWFWHRFVLRHHIAREEAVTARYDRLHCSCGKKWKVTA